MSQNIYDLANELERSLRALPEYQTVVSAKAALSDNAEAQALLKDYTDFQIGIQNALQNGQMPTEEDQEKMNDYVKKIEATPLVADFFAKQNQLSVYVTDIERIIFKPLQELLD